jgi:hypothetical protein
MSFSKNLLSLIEIYSSAIELYDNRIISLAGSEYWQKWYKKNKKRFVALVVKHKRNRRKEFKTIIDAHKDGKCIVCKKQYPPEAMDLCHRDAKDKLFRISDAGKRIYSKETLLKEIEKCDLYCGNCRKIQELKDIIKSDDKKKKLRLLVDGLKNIPCAECGKSYPSYVMEFHHINGDKAGTIAEMINNTNSKAVLDEIAKTEVLCINCHRTKTRKQREQ